MCIRDSVSGVLLGLGQVRGAWLYGVGFAVTVVWSLFEAGLAFWPLAARLGLLAVIGLLVALVTPSLRGAAACRHVKPASRGVAGVLALGLVAALITAFQPIWSVKPTAAPELAQGYQPGDDGANWTNYGRTPDGTQFAPLDQICLLYTSDAADDTLREDLGGRRIIKKKRPPSR